MKKERPNDGTLTADDLFDWCGWEPWRECLAHWQGREDELIAHWAKHLLDGYPSAEEVKLATGMDVRRARTALQKARRRHAGELLLELAARIEELNSTDESPPDLEGWSPV